MRNRRAALATLAALALTLSACGKDSESSPKGGTIGIAMPTRASERWLTDGKSIVTDLKAKATRPNWSTATTTPRPRSPRSRA